ncbi:hypothetical protein PACTADRAFT_2737 [Pachysolen tannophilus NRRL Y-2460]|uniref:FAD dependent oxidoreductase domain-containing protein n=1 Tax=Pachysolen tannophilus NRRL Y-2460 TaxID=669874 RepID=A0A1E4TXI4_PACTA|nr:hypothetical protein PACTADRAFT_2737 [Pachysolen tannophilus NRRL Y-2460]
MSQESIVIVGAGIVGLYTAFSLLEKGVSPNEITVVAQYLPGDQSTYYTSPWAGGNFSCISPDDQTTIDYDKFTYTNIHKIQKKLGGAKCGLDNRPSTEYWDFQPSERKLKSLKSYLVNMEILPQEKLPDGAVYGISYLTWNFDCPRFLENFQNYLESQGIVFIRKKLTHISQAYLSSETKTVFNCTGIGAHSLGGVNDTKVYPSRGQVVVIKAPHVQVNKLRWGKDYATYIIPRPDSGGQVILGGYLQKDNWIGDTFKYETESIIKRTTELMPEILEAPLEIIRIAAGLRPSRHGGVRIAKEVAEEQKVLIHNYGASGYGYQAGYGMANSATDLLFKTKSKL